MPNSSTTANDIAKAQDLTILGDANRAVNHATNLSHQVPDGIAWIKSEKHLESVKNGTVIVHESLNIVARDEVTFLVCKQNPKLVFSLVLKNYFAQPEAYYLKNCVEEHRKNNQIKIGDGTFIGQDVEIGEGTVIFPNVTIEAGTRIGKNCIIKTQSSLGTEGMGLQLNEETGLLEKFPQIGNVLIEDHVEIGPNSTVRRSALTTTYVRRGAKIGSLTNVGHNCDVGENTILTSGIILAGSSTIGKDVFVGINVAVRNGVKIGDHAEIGMGAVVTKDVAANTTVFGNPAKPRQK